MSTPLLNSLCLFYYPYDPIDNVTHRVGWYSCMTGKKSTARLLLRLLGNVGIRNIRSTRFFQGSTTRWGIAWSYSSLGINSISSKDKVRSDS